MEKPANNGVEVDHAVARYRVYALQHRVEERLVVSVQRLKHRQADILGVDVIDAPAVIVEHAENIGSGERQMPRIAE